MDRLDEVRLFERIEASPAPRTLRGESDFEYDETEFEASRRPVNRFGLYVFREVSPGHEVMHY